jgi:ATP-dependent protease ClpP protease subunit
MIQHYQDCTGLSKEEIERDLLGKDDAWLTGKEAKKYNLVDEVATSNKTKKLRAVKKKIKSKPKTKK